MIVRARIVLPITQPPIENGAVLIARGRITAVGLWSRLSSQATSPVTDLGDAALLPGLVNAHCHLDYTDMAGLVPPLRSFSNWIKAITALKGAWSDADFTRSWRNGADMLLRNGVTTVGDIESVPNLLPGIWRETPLRVCSFLEMTGVRSRREPRLILDEALAKARACRHPRCRVGLSPHAPYSTTPELLQLSARASRQRRWPLATHVAESGEEFQMFTRGRGAMFDWLQRNERDMSDCGAHSPVQHLEKLGVLGRHLLAIHVNYLARGDAPLLARRGVHVVHCPRSHAYFRHDAFPHEELLRARVNLCVGTDSLATVLKRRKERVELNLFAELQALADAVPGLWPEALLRMVTVNAAAALGLQGRAGELGPGAWADLVAVPYAGPVCRVEEAVVQHPGPVAASLIGGRWLVLPKTMTGC
jgi:cytosine/adenosine deaminase-related metal-dependent hydrolase